MAYIRLSDFRNGIDKTRPIYAADPGTLSLCVNGHITRGGDIERRLPFDPIHTIPAGTFGLHAIGSKLFVFGSAASPSIPAGLSYQQLAAPNAPAMTAVLDSESFGGSPYVIAAYDDGSIHHFYDGVRVADWDAIAAGDSSIAGVAEYLAAKLDLEPAFRASAVGGTITVIAQEPGTAFTISGSATDGGGTADESVTITQIQANVPAVEETQATASFEITAGNLGDAGDNAITSITVDGLDLINAVTIDWIDSNEFLATLASQAVNAESDNTGYSSSVAGAVVTITSPTGTGAAANGDVLAVGVSGTVTVGGLSNMSAGVTQVAAVSQIEEIVLAGTFEADDSWLLTVDGVDYRALGFTPGMGEALKTYDSKMYAAAGRKLRFSALDDPTDWSTVADGAGFVAFANQDGTSERLVGIEQFLDDLAVFARRAVQIEQVDPDPQLNALRTTLSNTGAVAGRSIINYANTDVFYLSDAGIRSLRPRATTDSAFSTDVGVNVDTNVVARLADATATQIQNVVSVLEPTHSRLLMAIGDAVYVFNYFPGKGIAAWTTYELDFTITEFAVIGRILYARSGDTVYAYGGLTGDRLPEAGEVELTVQTPYLSGDRDALHKTLLGIDLAAKGTFAVKVLIDPNEPTVETGEVLIDKITHPYGRIPIEAYSSHFSALMTCSDAGEVTLSNLIMHFEPGEEA